MAAVSQSLFLQALGWAVINSLWQMAFLWLVYQLILIFIPKINAGKKAYLASWILFIGFTWFIYTLISSIVNKEIVSPSSIANIIKEESRLSILQNVLPAASVMYLFVLVIPVWRFVRNYSYVQLLRRQGIGKINVDWKIFVKNTSARMGIFRKVQIWLSEIVDTPVTIGFLKPIILIPVAAINNLTPQQVEAIILHELSHIRRFDYLFNLIINFIKTILYFNPFVQLFVKRIEKERENSCDEMVVQFQYQPHEYASALLTLERTGLQHRQMMLAALGRNRDLLHRIETILGLQKTTRFTFRQLILPLITLIGIILMNILISSAPQKNAATIFSFNNEINPYYFFLTKNKKELNPDNSGFITKNDLARKNSGKINNLLINNPKEPNDLIAPSPAIYNAGYSVPVIPDLAEKDEEKVKQTVDATKKILAEKEWCELEKSYADAFSSAEKAKLKNEYRKELNKINWNNLENKLRLSYTTIDWENVNNQIITSLTQIKMDSITSVVNLVLHNMEKAETWMKENRATSIPDTDITLPAVKEKKQKVKAQLEKILKIKNRKIVRI